MSLHNTDITIITELHVTTGDIELLASFMQFCFMNFICFSNVILYPSLCTCIIIIKYVRRGMVVVCCRFYG